MRRIHTAKAKDGPIVTRAIEDFAASKARLDELRREKEQQQPSPDTDTGPDAPNPEPVCDYA